MCDLAEGRELLGVERMMQAFGAGEVAHHQRDAVVAGIDPGNDALRFPDRQPEPVHAGVDMNGGAAGPAGAPAEHVPFGEFVEIADHGPGVDLGEGLAAILEEAAEHIDRRRRQRRAGDTRFIQCGDEEGLAAGASQRAGDRTRPAAIGVGLDDAGAFGRHGGFLELAPVGDDGVEIDGEDAIGGRKVRRLVGFGREQGADRYLLRIGNDVHAALYAQPVSGSTGAGPLSSCAKEAGRPARDRRSG